MGAEHVEVRDLWNLGLPERRISRLPQDRHVAGKLPLAFGQQERERARLAGPPVVLILGQWLIPALSRKGLRNLRAVIRPQVSNVQRLFIQHVVLSQM